MICMQKQGPRSVKTVKYHKTLLSKRKPGQLYCRYPIPNSSTQKGNVAMKRSIPKSTQAILINRSTIFVKAVIKSIVILNNYYLNEKGKVKVSNKIILDAKIKSRHACISAVHSFD